MIISDLNFCEKIDFSNTIVGGATADTDGSVYAGPGVAYAEVTAVATGDSTGTYAKATTRVIEAGKATISIAQIKGDAWAVDADGDRDRDKINETAVYPLVNN